MISFPAWSRRRLVATRSRRGLSSGFIIQMQLMRLMLKTFGTILESARTRTSAWAVRMAAHMLRWLALRLGADSEMDFCWIWKWVLAARPTTSLVFGAMVCYDLSISRLENFNVAFFHGIHNSFSGLATPTMTTCASHLTSSWTAQVRKPFTDDTLQAVDMMRVADWFASVVVFKKGHAFGSNMAALDTYFVPECHVLALCGCRAVLTTIPRWDM